jgi:hypothetical protein
MCGGGEGGIREVEKDDGGLFILREESLEYWRVKLTVEFTVHRGAAAVLGSEG